MKNKLILFTLGVTVSIFVLNGCKKDNTSAVLDSQTQQFTTDNSSVKSESDQLNTDVNNILGSSSANGGRKEVSTASFYCGVKSIDSSGLHSNPKTLVFYYDGITPCPSPSRTRSGKITVQLINGNYWSDKGAILKITCDSFKVTRISNGYSMLFNGSKTLENVNGTNWIDLYLGSTVQFKERAIGVKVTFNDNSQATWNQARLTSWNYSAASGGIWTLTADGDTTINNVTKTDSWGVTRYGTNFLVNFSAPWVSNTYCSLWAPISGKVNYNINNTNFSLTFGVDQNGNATTLACGYGFEISWTKSNGSAASLVISY